jgi:hypothetical protein
MVAIACRELKRLHGRRSRRRQDAAHKVQALERQTANLASAIAEGGQLQTLLQKLSATELALEQARVSLRIEETRDSEQRPSASNVEQHLAETLLDLASRSYEFTHQLRRLFPSFVIQPIQQLDCGQVRSRAKLIFLPRVIRDDGLAQLDQNATGDGVEIELDLFEPPKFIRHLPDCLATKQAHPQLSLKGVAASLGINHMTVKRAFDYARLLDRLGTRDPYREISECPTQASRWRQPGTNKS